MEFQRAHIEQLKTWLGERPMKIVTVSHTNPDGDAIGSSLAWAELLRAMGHTVTSIVPNRHPYFLNWMPHIKDLVIFKFDAERALEAIREADMIFCLDFNALSRLEILTDALSENTHARRVLIDHHLSPPTDYALMFSHPELCSTAFLTYKLIEQMKGTEAITTSIAENLYAGIMTDTGNFAFSTLTPDLMRAVAVLLEHGLDIPKVNTAVYNSYSADRVRLLGYSLCHKMELLEGGPCGLLEPLGEGDAQAQLPTR